MLKKNKTIILTMIFCTCFINYISHSNTDSLLLALQKSKIDTNKVKIYNNLSASLINTHLTNSLKFADSALELSKKLNWKIGVATSKVNIANAQYFKSDFKNALKNYKDALLIYQQNNLKDRYAVVLGNIGIIYIATGYDSIGVSYYLNAIENAKELKDNSTIHRNYMNLGSLYQNQMNHKKALEYYFLALKYAKKTNDKLNLSILYGNIGNTYNYLSKYDEAVSYYKKSLEINLRIENNLYLVYNYFNLATLYISKSNYNEALFYLKKSVDLQDKIDDHLMTIQTRCGLAFTYALLNQFDEAIEINNETYEKYIKNNKIDDFNKAYYYQYCGRVYYLKFKFDYSKNKKLNQDLEKAIYYFELSEKLYDVKKVANNLLEFYKLLIDLYSIKKDYKKAFIKLEYFNNYNDSVNKIELQKSTTEFEQRLEIEHKDSQINIQKLKLEKNKLEKYYLYIGLILLILILIILVYQYKLRVKNAQNLKLKNEEISTINEKLEIVNKEVVEINNIKDKIFNVIAHDLIGPISNFKNFTEILSNNADEFDKDELVEYHQSMYESSESLLEMLKNLLDWSRNQRRQVDVDIDQYVLNDFVSSNLNLLKLSFHNKNIEVINNLDTNLVANLYVFTDSNLTQTVIRNILTNAIKFTPQNGKITIDYEIDENKQTTILLIKDNGVGIPQDKLTSIFELKKDKTTWGTNNEKGTGLGLTLCKDFMLLNKGNIEIESQEGEGTKVMLTFLNVYENTI